MPQVKLERNWTFTLSTVEARVMLRALGGRQKNELEKAEAVELGYATKMRSAEATALLEI